MFRGSITALITPFKKGQVDEQAFQDFVNWQIEQGTHGVVPCGTTGKSPTLSHDEHRRVVELCVEVAKGKIPVIAGTGSNSTSEAIELTAHAKKAGADAALIVTPYYNKPTQDGLILHYLAIANAVDIPIIIYNIPGRSVVDMHIETMEKLAEHKNIVGVKDATNDLSRPAKIALSLGESFCQLSGEDGTAVAFLAQGGHGCISVTSNVAPNLCAQLQDAWHLGAYEDAFRVRDILTPLHDAMFIETSPAPVKFGASLLGKCLPDVRPPLAPLKVKTKARVEEAMRNAGLLSHSSPMAMISHGTVAQNRKARHDFAIEDTIEAGIVLTGSEVKSLRRGRCTLVEAFAQPEGGDLYLVNAHIPAYEGASHFQHDERRKRKLLLHRKEIERLAGDIGRKGMTLVPLSLYFNDRGVAKVQLGLAKGKTHLDRREDIKKREWKREQSRLMRAKG